MDQGLNDVLMTIEKLKVIQSFEVVPLGCYQGQVEDKL
jgi:hypothetical protein